MKYNKAFLLVNLITFYRLTAAPVLVILLIRDELTTFKYLLALSFLTDAVDGYLARRFNVISILGARVDSVADDLTVMAAIIGLFVYFPGFIRGEWLIAGALAGLYVLQNGLAIIRYCKLTSFHTYSAKLAAILQGLFLVSCFFLTSPLLPFFYLTAGTTIIDLTEEILLIMVLPKWEANVKGMYWVLTRKRTPL
jgi:CDP-diacylglycerol--glycerol-3-phosphate 3-phosphatidyltransferase